MWTWPDDVTPVKHLLLDHFVGVDGTLLTAHAPDIGPGGDWLSNTTSCQLFGNTAVALAAATDTNHIAFAPSALPIKRSGVLHIIYQWINPVAGTSLDVGFNGAGESGGITVHLNASFGIMSCKCDDGTFTEALDVPIPVDNTVPHHVVMSWDGSTARFYFDGVQKAQIIAPWLNFKGMHRSAWLSLASVANPDESELLLFDYYVPGI